MAQRLDHDEHDEQTEQPVWLGLAGERLDLHAQARATLLEHEPARRGREPLGLQERPVERQLAPHEQLAGQRVAA